MFLVLSYTRAGCEQQDGLVAKMRRRAQSHTDNAKHLVGDVTYTTVIPTVCEGWGRERGGNKDLTISELEAEFIT